ncbi:MAG: hypothetical protein KDE27_08025, partial [Planctomycetes bacterium]|nr:hypothetical protein [Planctomycetota bacterium]
MKTLTIGLCCLTSILAWSAPVLAHGGQYRGPGDVVPPGGGGRGSGAGGPTTGGPGGPSGPGPGGPVTP